MSELTICLGFTLTVFLSYLFIRRIVNQKCKAYATGPYGFPIIGHLPLFGKHPPTTFMKWWKSYGDVFSIRMGSWDAVVVNGYSAVKAAGDHPDDAFSGRPPFVTTELLKERNNEDTFAFGNFSPVYLKQRNLASKALRLFTSKRPGVIEDIVYNEATAFADSLIENYRNVPGYIEFEIQTFVVRILHRFLYGKGKQVNIEQHVKVIVDAIKNFNDFSGNGSIIDVLPWLRYVMPWKINRFRVLLSLTDGITWSQVHDHYKTFSKDEIRDVADAILASDAQDETNQDRYTLTRSRLNLTLSDLQGAGADTTHKTLVWLLLYICAYPNVQERVHAEIEEIVGKIRKVDLNDKSKLSYTNAVIYEVMRIVTPLPFSLPHYAIKDGNIKGVHVDKGTVVFFHLYAVHHEKEFWGDPETFRPERFLLENNTLDKEKCKHVMPFSIGRRRCVGEFLANMIVFLSFATIMQKCRFVTPPGDHLDLSSVPGLVYSAKDFRVRVCTND